MSYLQPNLSIEEFIKLVEKYSDEQYGISATADNSAAFNDNDGILAEAEARKERMLRKGLLAENSGWNLTDATMETIRAKVHTAGNLQVGRFIVKIKNYKTDSDKKTTVTLDIHEEKVNKSSFTAMKMPQRVNVLKDIRFSGRPWLQYFNNTIAGGKDIPIKTAADIVRWCQAIHRMGAFV